MNSEMVAEVAADGERLETHRAGVLAVFAVVGAFVRGQRRPVLEEPVALAALERVGAQVGLLVKLELGALHELGVARVAGERRLARVAELVRL